MDPNNNLTPGLVPTPTPTPASVPTPASEPTSVSAAAPVLEPTPMPASSPASEPAIPDLAAQLEQPLAELNNQMQNPAVDVANAAMAGATPVVTTTDLNAADVPAEPALQMAPLEPTLQAPLNQTAPLEPELPEGPVSLAPSAGFEMPEVATVSATPNGADPNLAMNNIEVGAPMDGNPAAPENPAAPGNPESDTANPENNPENQAQDDQVATPENTEPIIAAAPVPGSIGSAKSYADIQREEAEKAAKAAASQSKKIKLSKNTIIIIAIAVIAVIGLVVGAIMIFGGSSSTPTPTVAPTSVEEDEGVSSTLSCKRTLAEDEYVSFGAIGGTWENVFYFKDDVLDGLETNINYTYLNAAIAGQWKTALEAQYGVTTPVQNDSSDETNEPSTEADTSDTTTGAKTTAEMLHHSIIANDVTVTHKMEVKSEDIEEWVTSDAYSDVTYGAKQSTTEDEEEVERNLDYYKNLQNSINYTCSISK